MNSNRRNTAVLLAGLAVGAGLAALAFVWRADGEEALGLALRITAQLGLGLYLLVFVARPLGNLSRNPAVRWLGSRRRLVGIAFAAVMIVHLALILYLHYGVTGEGIAPGALPTGGLVYLLILAMLITSWDEPARRLGARNWKRLHKAGLYLIGLPFALTIVGGLAGESAPPRFALFTAAIVAAIAIRVAAWFRLRANAAAHARLPGA